MKKLMMIGLMTIAPFVATPAQSMSDTQNQDCTESHNNEFFQALGNGDLTTVKKYIAEGVDVNQLYQIHPGGCYTTALHIATLGGQYEMVVTLLDAGADINIQADYVCCGDTQATPLHAAVFHGKVVIAELLITKGADIEARDTLGHTALHYAVLTGWPENVVTTLINAGANVNARDHDDLTPLHYAALAGYTDRVKTLLEKGADTNARAKCLGPLLKNGTPLHMAALGANTEIVKLLLEHGANTALLCSDDEDHLYTAYDLAIKYGHEKCALAGHQEIAKLLAEHVNCRK